MSNNTVILTGDRPTGALHLGHYAGSLKERVRLQNEGHKCFIMVADIQAYTDNADNTAKIVDAIPHVVADYIGVGLDPNKSTIFLQSAVPELTELTILYMNMVTVSRLERNPTVKDEIEKRGFERDIPSGFLCYPVSQAADITAFKGTHVPVGDDQLPMIEQAQEVARKINRAAGYDLIPEPRASLSKVTRLPGIDGKAKASKSLGNAIYMSDSADELKRKVMMMYTDDTHLRVTDPGKVEGNAVFAYLDAFDPNKDEVSELKEHYRRGGLGDVKLKRRLIDVLEAEFAEVRVRRNVAFTDKEALLRVLRQGSEQARDVAADTLREVKKALKVFVL